MPAPSDSQIPTTKWTLIERLKSEDVQEAHRALNELCLAYHYPLYCYIRHRGLNHHDTEDALHDFFAKLLRNDSFAEADQDKGRLRAFLVTALQRFLLNWQRDQRRHTDREISRDALTTIAAAEQRYLKEEPDSQESPDHLYDRQWARELMGQVLSRLRSRYEKKGQTALFDALRPVLLSGGSLREHDSDALASSLGMRTGALRTALMRLLSDFQDTLKKEVLETISDATAAQEEMRSLINAFSVSSCVVDARETKLRAL